MYADYIYALVYVICEIFSLYSSDPSFYRPWRLPCILGRFSGNCDLHKQVYCSIGHQPFVLLDGLSSG